MFHIFIKNKVSINKLYIVICSDKETIDIIISLSITMVREEDGPEFFIVQ